MQLTDGYVLIKDGELFLIGCRINALRSASTHVSPEADRTKKLLLHKEEILKLAARVSQGGYTLVPLSLYFQDGRAKVELAVAKGKDLYDKRRAIKERDTKREIQRAMSERY